MKLYNTLSKNKEVFKAIEPGVVRMYSCGPTVYGYIHIGNARPMVVFDTLRRYLEYKGYKVLHAQNYTDVDDKIINLSVKEGVPASQISERFIAECQVDETGLGILSHTFKPKVTEEMHSIISMIASLLEAGMAYENNGTIYYNTAKFPQYGCLSGKNIEDLESGARVETDEKKLSPSDFVLWKPAKPSEPFWEAPWGQGRPGWHIECSAMIHSYLGETIDIHAGGEDLIFPHHENEIAQSQALSGAPLANYWLHNSFVNIDNQKMAKSRGNFFTVRDISKKYPYDVIRFLLVSAHYRMPLNFSEDLLVACQNGLRRIKNCAEKLATKPCAQATMNEAERAILAEADKFRVLFEAALDNDLNTADGVSAIFELVRFSNTHAENASKELAQGLLKLLTQLCTCLGINLQKASPQADITIKIERLIQERQQAKQAKNFNKADEIRNQLLELGVSIKDTREGTSWTII